MKTVVLFFLLLPTLAFGQYDRYGEHLAVEDIAGNTISISGQHFGIDSGPEMEFKWEVYKNEELYQVHKCAEDKRDVKLTLAPGNYRIVRYTYYYSEGQVTGITESESLIFSFPLKDPIKEYDVVPVAPHLPIGQATSIQ